MRIISPGIFCVAKCRLINPPNGCEEQRRGVGACYQCSSAYVMDEQRNLHRFTELPSKRQKSLMAKFRQGSLDLLPV